MNRSCSTCLAELHAQGRTILMVTHDDQVGRCADIRINLEHGRIVETTHFSMEENQDFDEVLEQLWIGARADASTRSPSTSLPRSGAKSARHDGAHRPGRATRRRESPSRPEARSAPAA